MRIYISGPKLFWKYLQVTQENGAKSRYRIYMPTILCTFFYKNVSLEYRGIQTKKRMVFSAFFHRLKADIKQNGFSFLRHVYIGYKVKINSADLSELIKIELYDSTKETWVSRLAITQGISSNRLNHSIEYDFSRFLNNFGLFVWGLRGIKGLEKVKFDSLKSRAVQVPSHLKQINQLSFIDLQFVSIFHGQIAIKDQIIYPTDMFNFIDNSWPTDMVFKENNQLRIIESKTKEISITHQAIFFGTSTSWFHFIVEVFPRFLLYGISNLSGKAIIVGPKIPKQIVEILSLLKPFSIIECWPFEEIKVENITISCESRYPGGLEITNRAEDIKLSRDFIIKNVIGEVFKDISVNNHASKICLVRDAQLFRRSEEMFEVQEFLRTKGFSFINTGRLSIK